MRLLPSLRLARIRAAGGLLLLALLATPDWAAARTQPVIIGQSSPEEATAVLELVDEFSTWIAANSEYPIADAPIRAIVFVDADDDALAAGPGARTSRRTLGVYDLATATIYLARPWSADDVEDQSVLLHEITHHFQANARHWYCPQAMEWDAYKLQESWLKTRGVEPNFFWPQILLESSCARRDHHPD